MSCQLSLQGKGHNFLINSAWSRNMEPLVLQNIALPKHHGLNSGSLLHHSHLPILPLSRPHRLLRSVKFSMFNLSRNHHLSITKTPYILSLSLFAKLIVDPCFLLALEIQILPVSVYWSLTFWTSNTGSQNQIYRPLLQKCSTSKLHFFGKRI